MPVCPKCGGAFAYAETHVCEGRDKRKVWLLALVAIGALVGGPLGRLYGLSIVRQACAKPDASNLCGLTSAPTIPIYIVIGAVIGATVVAIAGVVFFLKRKA